MSDLLRWLNSTDKLLGNHAAVHLLEVAISAFIVSHYLCIISNCKRDYASGIVEVLAA